jgi:hypothetical protein
MAAMVMAPGSVINEPRIGAMMRMVSHQAAGVFFPRAATQLMQDSAKRNTGRVEAMAMITKTKSGSVKLTV